MGPGLPPPRRGRAEGRPSGPHAPPAPGGIGVLVRWLLNAVVLLLLPYVLEGVRVQGPVAAVVAAAVLGIVNAVIRPVLLFLTLPLNLLTLGLFTFVVNALMLLLVGAVVPGFEVGGFWVALVASVLLSVASALLSAWVR